MMTPGQITRRSTVFSLLCLLAVCPSLTSALAGPLQMADEGIRFSCPPGRIGVVASGMERYLASVGISPAWVVKRMDRSHGVAVFTLNTPREDRSTLDLAERPELQIGDEMVSLPAQHGKTLRIPAVSKKEILLALLQHGRLTEFKGRACDVRALQAHVGVRQNIAAWAENLNWIWPDGEAAKWNDKYWKLGTPKPGVPLYKAVGDVFLNQEKYSVGCYTASKLVMVQGVLDYFRRVEKNPALYRKLVKRLARDREPLLGVEPGRMWDFEANFDPRERERPGKLLKIQYGVAAGNFVPGDWIYFLNTDPVSQKKIGYEGSNPIYLGRNKFSDYFNDHDHAYTYRQKADEVYQWRNGVFSRSRDFAKIKPPAPDEWERLNKTPADGGILMDLRVFPYLFGYEALP